MVLESNLRREGNFSVSDRRDMIFMTELSGSYSNIPGSGSLSANISGMLFLPAANETPCLSPVVVMFIVCMAGSVLALSKRDKVTISLHSLRTLSIQMSVSAGMADNT